jgi:hypothetical protein
VVLGRSAAHRCLSRCRLGLELKPLTVCQPLDPLGEVVQRAKRRDFLRALPAAQVAVKRHDPISDCHKGHLIEAPWISPPLTVPGKWRAQRLDKMFNEMAAVRLTADVGLRALPSRRHRQHLETRARVVGAPKLHPCPNRPCLSVERGMFGCQLGVTTVLLTELSAGPEAKALPLRPRVTVASGCGRRDSRGRPQQRGRHRGGRGSVTPLGRCTRFVLTASIP